MFKHFNISRFQKSLTYKQIMEFVDNENFQYVIVEVTCFTTYGFDMKNIKQHEIAEDIVSQSWTYTSIEDKIIGWKIAKELPSWSKGVAAWLKFVQNDDQSSDASEEKEESEYNYEDDDEDKLNDHNKFNINLKQDSSDSDEDGYDDKAIRKGNKFEYIANTNESEEDNQYILSSEDNYNEQNKRICTSRSKSFVENIESEEDNNNSYISKITSVGTNNQYGIGNNQFNKVFDDDFMTKYGNNFKTSSQSDKIDVFVTGPFRNKNNGKSYYIVVLGDLKKAFVIKSLFIRGYLATIMSGLNVDSSQCNTFNDINIRQLEFGNDDKWKRSKGGKTISRVSFVFSCNTTIEGQIKTDLGNTMDILFKSMEKRENHPVGPIVLEYLNQHQNGLYKYLMKNKTDKETEKEVGNTLTEDIHNQFKSGYEFKWKDSLNRYMVDYDIMKVLKDHVGYKTWEDVGMNEMKKCYRDFDSAEYTLPAWGMEQERF